MAAGKSRDIKDGAKDDLVLLGSNGSKLYWLLLPRYFRSFKKKTHHDIDQYAVRIPYPSVNQ